MKTFYKSYLRAFQKYDQSLLNEVPVIETITQYALVLNVKANQLLRRASLNEIINLAGFQKELFETGRDYVQKFSILLRKKS